MAAQNIYNRVLPTFFTFIHHSFTTYVDELVTLISQRIYVFPVTFCWMASEVNSAAINNIKTQIRKTILIKSRVKPSRYTPWRRLGERRYSSYSFTTSALDGGEWSASRPDRALPPGKGPPVPTGEEAGWAPEPVWTQTIEEKFFAPVGDRTPIARSSSP
jgi:hypothetical protein